ncbi:MAG: hypothetical protein WBD22_00290 [Pyrinomonadaceae bacterium]
MNENELKSLWIEAENKRRINFEELEKSLSTWQDGLHKKVKMDIWAQSIATVLTLVPVFFYPKLIFASLMVVVLGIWYVWELRKLDQQDRGEVNQLPVKQSLKTRALTLIRYLRRTRVVMYLLTPWIIPAVFYGIGTFDNPSITLTDWALSLVRPIVIYEIVVVIATEIYFRITYASAMDELKILVWQLNSEDNL